MSRFDFSAPRLFVEAPLARGAAVAASAEQANYLVNVLRLRAGDAILVFNGRDGEWRARLDQVAKRGCMLVAVERTRAQEGDPDIDYLFAPLKRARLDYMAQKATEMGAARLRPVLTRRTVAERVNLDRLRANAVEAAEQCGILRVPEVMAPVTFTRMIEAWESAPCVPSPRLRGEGQDQGPDLALEPVSAPHPNPLPVSTGRGKRDAPTLESPRVRHLIFCDEDAPIANPIEALSALEPGPVAVVIGPEGGFTPEERELLMSKSFTTAISLGPRILRADTAAVAALALVEAVMKDWKEK